jgi:hypothetical protein
LRLIVADLLHLRQADLSGDLAAAIDGDALSRTNTCTLNAKRTDAAERGFENHPSAGIIAFLFTGCQSADSDDCEIKAGVGTFKNDDAGILTPHMSEKADP